MFMTSSHITHDKNRKGKTATEQKAALYGLLRWIARMFSTLLARMTITLIMFGDFVPYPGAKRVLPQWAG